MIPNLQLKLCDSHHSSPFNYATFYSFSKILCIHHSLLAFPTYASRLFYLVAFLTSHINCYCPDVRWLGLCLPSFSSLASGPHLPPCLLSSSLKGHGHSPLLHGTHPPQILLFFIFSKQELFTFSFISPSTH